ncbi:GNAT family N-acetyltransferase [Dasania sp. GY-MA-18]|uniref:Protein ElaA n=1 Tax=Dasania phycosphaerae TaxID=2950436 RepID=A0A9J6RMZ7_9GAMM|nr:MULTISPECIES: GNAT family N-acetyltransferase [Dasania]MCR8923427.1 GNAT family N-acetyltransferase [Dasania sp. GY-MA-18]MCZ0865860.1 GNAT family N-acetyltransferase [Dasania phycosphaerae]MCZ0869584.1 GNAT family N-acetyltransferase [Dasania phycosphaerae]
MNWICLPFKQLNTEQLYELIKLRVDVFIVEQDCPYNELDNKDRHPGCYHLLGYKDGQLAAYSRLLAPGISFDHVSIGRVVTHPDHRGGGLGQQLIEQAIEQCQQLWPACTIDIGAQLHLSEFYGRFGFKAFSDSYLEDGIPHIDMRRSPQP